MSKLGHLCNSVNIRNGERCGLTSVDLTYESNGTLLLCRRRAPFHRMATHVGGPERKLALGRFPSDSGRWGPELGHVGICRGQKERPDLLSTVVCFPFQILDGLRQVLCIPGIHTSLLLSLQLEAWSLRYPGPAPFSSCPQMP